MHQLPLYPSFYVSEVEKLLDNTDGEVMQEYALLSMTFTLAASLEAPAPSPGDAAFLEARSLSPDELLSSSSIFLCI